MLLVTFQQKTLKVAFINDLVKLGRINGDSEGNLVSTYRVMAFPTIIFFRNGERIDFSGDRTKEGFINWINKKIHPLISEVTSQTQLDQLQSHDMPSLVLFSKEEEAKQKFTELADSDTNNRYYVVVGELISKYDRDFVQLHRNFGKMLTHQGISDRFIWWRNKYSRPLVSEFDSNVIYSIFRKQQSAVIVFNVEQSTRLIDLVRQIAQDYQGDLIITEIKPNNANLIDFAAFLRVNINFSRIVALDSKKQMKAVLTSPVSAITYQNLMDFITSVQKGEARLYPPNEEVQIEQAEYSICTPSEPKDSKPKG